MICFPNAKINIGLRVTGKRPDGYHNIESILYPIGLTDMLEISEQEKISGKGISLVTTGIKIDSPPEKNLVFRTAELLRKEYSIPPLNIHLHKLIPTGSGLGGGSSDTSFLLRVLNENFNIGITEEKLHAIASGLGSDCPFFLNNNSAFISGRGEKIQRISLDLSRFYLVVVYPDIHVDTGLAYSQITPSKPGLSLQKLIKYPVSQWKENIFNDFEKPVFSEFPNIKKIKEKLYRMGAIYSSLTGSGSAVYGLFDKKTETDGQFGHYLVWQERLSKKLKVES
ncbi:MAG: 4-(cytidine 5'-diphospho)-2-C-methyl-D-erythritol kinase [Bacteroidales bacterium]|nr:4-(cytidine 5'-diphospho)-2-C-methyl-D-erythritol kinase [Bacteroidales bacterium]